MALWSDLIVGAFGSGHIRVFSSSKGSLLAEVAAHAKWINAIDVAHVTGMVCNYSVASLNRLSAKCGSTFAISCSFITINWGNWHCPSVDKLGNPH